MIGIGDELVPLRALNADGEGIGVEAGARNHGENVTVARVHGNDGAVAVAESQFGGALQIVVNGQVNILAGLRVLNAEMADLAAAAVDQNIA